MCSVISPDVHRDIRLIRTSLCKTKVTWIVYTIWVNVIVENRRIVIVLSRILILSDKTGYFSHVVYSIVTMGYQMYFTHIIVEDGIRCL